MLRIPLLLQFVDADFDYRIACHRYFDDFCQCNWLWLIIAHRQMTKNCFRQQIAFPKRCGQLCCAGNWPHADVTGSAVDLGLERMGSD